MRNRIALITGASSGLGREFALQIDKLSDVDEIWLVARREEKLSELSSGLTKQVRILALDLADEDSFATIKDEIKAHNPIIGILVNSAGMGNPGTFEKTEASFDDHLLKLNVLALVRLTHIALPYCEAGSRILQISSVAAFIPQPNFSVYSASKAFVLYFARSLHQELAPRRITVTCVCPNPMETEFFKHEKNTKLIDRLKSHGTEKVEKVAAKALARSARGKDLSVSSFSARLIRVLAKILPQRLLIKVIGGMG
ncbi:MAG TPA: SDR family NAD(P)-dependent oxidoreductase [Clostridiaceae bacterium]|nr:SDR family NAD(P)-dependent oxidoreductase [Clostridiaceae bacterium]